MILKNNALFKLKENIVFGENYKEKDFPKQCSLFESMVFDLCPENQDILASFVVANISKEISEMSFALKLAKFKAGLLINPDNQAWFKKMPKSFLKKIRKKMEGKKEKAKYSVQTCCVCGVKGCERFWKNEYWHLKCLRKAKKVARKQQRHV